VLCAESATLALYRDTLPEGVPPTNVPLPPDAFVTSETCIAVAPASSGLPPYWLANPSSPTIWGFGSEEEPIQLTLPEISDPTSIMFDDAGHLFAVSGDVLVEASFDPKSGEWQVLSNEESFFGQVTTESFFRVTRSRTNFDPALHAGPGWENLPEDEIEPGTDVPDCPADLTLDGIVNTDDLLVLLAQWGACGADCDADFDGNGVIDTTDMLVLIGAWGNC